MTPPLEYATETPLKASFKIKTDTNTWEFVHKSAPSLELAFDLFPHLEAIQVQFLKPSPTSPQAFLSHVPKAWVRVNGEIQAYKPGDNSIDAYGLSGYLLEVGNQISPLLLSTRAIDRHVLMTDNRFSLLLTSSACLVRNPVLTEDLFDNLNPGLDTLQELVEMKGFTSRMSPGGVKVKRLHAQMHVVCDILSKEIGIPVDFDRIHGSLGEK
jgi:hypothetical protein